MNGPNCLRRPNIDPAVRRSGCHAGGVKAVLALVALLAASQIAGATIASGDAAKHVDERPRCPTPSAFAAGMVIRSIALFAFFPQKRSECVPVLSNRSSSSVSL